MAAQLHSVLLIPLQVSGALTSQDQIWKTSGEQVRVSAQTAADWNNTVLALHHLPRAPITLQQPCSLPQKVPVHGRSHTVQSDCGSSAFAHIFTIIQYELIAIKLLLQQLTIVPQALQFQGIPINT